MSIELSQETRKTLVASLQSYAAEHLDYDLEGLPAEMLLDFILKEIGPSVYNKAVMDAQAFIVSRAADMEGVLSEPEFGYHEEKGVRRRK